MKSKNSGCNDKQHWVGLENMNCHLRKTHAYYLTILSEDFIKHSYKNLKMLFGQHDISKHRQENRGRSPSVNCKKLSKSYTKQTFNPAYHCYKNKAILQGIAQTEGTELKWPKCYVNTHQFSAYC